jgi:hypothetical protein
MACQRDFKLACRLTWGVWVSTGRGASRMTSSAVDPQSHLGQSVLGRSAKDDEVRIGIDGLIDQNVCRPLPFHHLFLDC